MEYKTKNKRGSHVGVVLSFVIFITFAVFLYTIIQPAIQTGQDKTAILNLLRVSLVENVSTDLTSASVTINRDIPPGQEKKGCLLFDEFINISQMKPPHIISKNRTEEIQMSNKTDLDGDGNLYDLTITVDNPESDLKFFKIYNASEFKEINEYDGNVNQNCWELKQDNSNNNYTIGQIKINENIFLSKIVKLINDYENNYEKVKNDLDIPSGTEFGFNFTYSNGTVIGTEKEAPQNVNVFAEELPIQYVNHNATIKPGTLLIKIW